MKGGQAAASAKRKACTPPRDQQAAMRMEEEEDNVFKEAQEKMDVIANMTKKLMDAGLTAQQADLAMGVFAKEMKDLLKVAAK